MGEKEKMDFDHINISAPFTLLQEVRDFYINVFGLVEGFRPQFSRPGFWLYDGERAVVHLFESDTHSGNKGTGHLDHVAIRKKGLSAFKARLEKLDIRFEVTEISGLGLTQVFLWDPAGIKLEVNFMDEFLS